MDAQMTSGTAHAAPLRILGICGSLRQRSYNRMALLAASELMPSSLSLELAELGGIPLYNGDVEAHAVPASVQRLAERVLAADAVLVASPEYNFSISGVLKNSIDWLSRLPSAPWRNKPVALLSATQGPLGGARHQYELRKVFTCLEAPVLARPEVFIGFCHERFDANGALVHPATRAVLTQQMEAFGQWLDRLRASAPHSQQQPHQ